MDKPILTTKGTSKKTKTWRILSMTLSPVFMLLILFIWLNSYPDYARDMIMDEYGYTIGIIIAIVIAFDLLWGLVQVAQCESYVDVYEDRMEGKGILKVIQMWPFKLDHSKIVGVACSANFLYINTQNGKYTILTDAQTAKEITEYFNKRA